MQKVIMNYVPPSHVVSPRDCVSHVRVLFDGGEDSVSIAEIEWEGENCFAARWNVARREWDDPEKQTGKTCIGMPTSRGFPVWFVLPDDLLDQESQAWKAINEARKNSK